jgi:hypothetical protein
MHAIRIQAKSFESRDLVWGKNKVNAFVEIVIPGLECKSRKLFSYSR